MYSQIHSAMTFTNNTSAQMSVNCWHYPSQENVHNSSSVISVYVFLWRIQMKCEKIVLSLILLLLSFPKAFLSVTFELLHLHIQLLPKG